jgi:alkanesulfonate monooxygenase SsuD/methylene tetrahydromethanopterin reductase-like flavin-dependent oxidoreductase (luciferase family)
VPPAESAARFREAVEIVLAAWRSEKLDYHGQFHHFEGVEVLPRPLQKPHPPVWVAASSEPAIAWAAEQGHDILMDPHSAHPEIARKRELYRSQLEAAGHTFEGREIPMARLIALARSPEEAETVARRGAGWMMGSYMTKAPAQAFDPKGLAGGGAPMDPVERYLNDVVIYGSPEQVVDQIQRLEDEMFLDYIMCAPLSHESFLLFTDEVLPKLL